MPPWDLSCGRPRLEAFFFRTRRVPGSAAASPVSAWARVGSSAYEATRVSAAQGVHTIVGSSPVGVVVVGYDAYDSYAYPGGLDQQIINPVE